MCCSHPPSLLRIINPTFFLHVKEVVNLLLIHLLVLILLHDLIVGILVMRGPVAPLHLRYPVLHLLVPLLGPRLVLGLPGALLTTLGQPVVDVREVVGLEAAVHLLHAVPGDVTR